jgi:hypothetical protein
MAGIRAIEVKNLAGEANSAAELAKDRWPAPRRRAGL